MNHIQRPMGQQIPSSTMQSNHVAPQAQSKPRKQQRNKKHTINWMPPSVQMDTVNALSYNYHMPQHVQPMQNAEMALNHSPYLPFNAYPLTMPSAASDSYQQFMPQMNGMYDFDYTPYSFQPFYDQLAANANFYQAMNFPAYSPYMPQYTDTNSYQQNYQNATSASQQLTASTSASRRGGTDGKSMTKSNENAQVYCWESLLPILNFPSTYLISPNVTDGTDDRHSFNGGKGQSVSLVFCRE